MVILRGFSSSKCQCNVKGKIFYSKIKKNSSASNRIINARDHASIQLNIADVDPVLGVMTGKYKTYAICGSIRQMGESDDSLNHMSKRDGILPQ